VDVKLGHNFAKNFTSVSAIVRACETLFSFVVHNQKTSAAYEDCESPLMSRHIVGSDQFAPNAVVFPPGVEAFINDFVHPAPSEFRATRLAAPARKGIVMAAFSFWARLANRQIAAIMRQAFQCGNRSLALIAVSHRYKSEPTGRAAHAIGHQLHVSYGPIRRKEIAQFMFGSGE
jgi:hypothetical protein